MAKHFLVVEDEEVWQRTLAHELRSFGHHHIASSKEHAMQLFRLQPEWAGLIVDLVLPDGNGFDLIEALRETNVNCPALVVTNHREHDFINRAHELDAEFLCKPPERESIHAFARRATVHWWTGSRKLTALVEEHADRYQLTPREQELVAASVAGMPRRLIAEELGVAENTLKGQIRVLLLKCHCKSLDELGYMVLREAISGTHRVAAERPGPARSSQRSGSK